MYDELVKSLRQCAEASCAGCKNDLVEIGCRGKLQREAADAIEELQGKHFMMKKTAEWLAEKVPTWIPVTERLPEHGWYLAYGPTIKMEVLHFHSVEEVWSSERYYNIEVTHWMPLPEPPKGE